MGGAAGDATGARRSVEDRRPGKARRGAPPCEPVGPPAPARRGRQALAGALQSLAVVVAFVAAGLALALAARAGFPLGGEAAYPAAAMVDSSPPPPPHRWLIDGYNVLHVGVLQGQARAAWWGSVGRSRLLERLEHFDEPGTELWVVFDGPRPTPQAASGDGPRVVFAPSADDWLLAQVRAAEDPAGLVVVTADRRLADRLRHRGARVVPPAELLRRCGT